MISKKESIAAAFYGTVSAIGAVTTIPQAIKIWHTHADYVDGLSLITWLAYLVISCFGITYGVISKKLAILLPSTAYLLIQIVIVVGILAETTTHW